MTTKTPEEYAHWSVAVENAERHFLAMGREDYLMYKEALDAVLEKKNEQERQRGRDDVWEIIKKCEEAYHFDSEFHCAVGKIRDESARHSPKK